MHCSSGPKHTYKVWRYPRTPIPQRLRRTYRDPTVPNPYRL